MGVLYHLGVGLPLSDLTSAVGTSPRGEAATLGLLFALLAFAFGLVNFVPGLAVTVRCLHDVDLSGWCYLLVLIPFVGGFILLVLLLLSPNRAAPASTAAPPRPPPPPPPRHAHRALDAGPSGLASTRA